MNFIFNFFIFLPVLRSRRNYVLFICGAAVIVLLSWWRNHSVIGDYAYLFTWDGMATRTKDYGLVSTLLPQLHPAVADATRALYKEIAPIPFNLYRQGHIAWGPLTFLALGAACIVASKRLSLVLAGLLPLVYFTFFDKTLSTNFFRHYLAIFPAFFMGIALAGDRIARQRRHLLGRSYLIWAAVVAVAVVSGANYLKPAHMIPVEETTPPPQALTKQYYMVNSGFYHPESLVYRFPDKRFIGLPLDPVEFEDFQSHYPQYTTIIWHQQFSVQGDLLQYLLGSGKFRVANAVGNSAGVQYLILEAQGQ